MIDHSKLIHFSAYKDALRSLIEDQETHQRGVRTSLAQHMGCQPAYLTRVLNGDADLSLEQIESAGRFFLLSEAQTEFLIALVGENRAGTIKLKAYWSKQLKEARERIDELKGRLDLNDSLTKEEMQVYYQSWHFSAIHAATSIPTLQKVSALTKYLHLTEDVVRSTLRFLVDAKLVVQKDDRFQVTSRRIHISRRDPLVYRHHLNWKLKSLETLGYPETNALRYTGVITISKEDAKKLKEMILSSIEKSRKLVSLSKDEILGCYSFEFFEIGDLSKGIK